MAKLPTCSEPPRSAPAASRQLAVSTAVLTAWASSTRLASTNPGDSERVASFTTDCRGISGPGYLARDLPCLPRERPTESREGGEAPIRSTATACQVAPFFVLQRNPIAILETLEVLPPAFGLRAEARFELECSRIAAWGCPINESSKNFPQLLPRYLTVAQDLAEKPGADCFSRMHRNERGVAVPISHEVMAATNPDDFETESLESCE